MWWDNYCSGTKVNEEWNENFCMPQEAFENFAISCDLIYKKNLGDFWCL